MKEIKITSPYITLGQFIKFVGLISNGGEAKIFLASNSFIVDGVSENRRGRKLYPNTIIKFNDIEYKICE